MKFTKLALTFLCSTMLFCGCAKNSDVVIKINDTNITRAEFNDDFNKIKNSHLKNAPKEMQKEDSYAVLALKEKYVDDVIIRTLLSQEFEKRKIEVTQDEINARIKKLAIQIGSEEEMKNRLKENNVSEERLNEDMANEVKLEKLMKSLNVKEANDSEAEKFYKENKEQFTLPERVQASHILIPVDSNEIRRQIIEEDKDAKLTNEQIDSKVEEQLAKQEALAKEVQKKASANPKNFAQLAKEYSKDPGSAPNGGDLGYFTKGQMVKEFEDAAFSQKVGAVGPLVKTQFGYHIILVKDRSAKTTQSFKEVKNDIKAYLTQQKKLEAIRSFVKSLKDKSKIEFLDDSINPEKLKKELEEAFKKQLDFQSKHGAPKSKQKKLEKMEKENK